MSDMRERIIKSREAKGLNQSEVGRLLGVTPQAVQKWESVGGPKAARLNKLAAVLGVTVDYLINGSDRPKQSDISASAIVSDARNEYMVDRAAEARRTITDRRDLDLISIPMLDTCGSMGIGCLQPAQDDVIANITAHLPSLRRHASFSSPDNLALITGYGDSMEGTFNDGDLLLVDRGVLETKLDAVYVLALDGELYIKRIQRRPNGDLLMISDNKKYEPYVIESSKIGMFQVLGRVILAWNARKL